jgi:hypothetical protein
MSLFVLILVFFGGLILIILVGSLIGHLFGLDKYQDHLQENKRHEFSK